MVIDVPVVPFSPRPPSGSDYRPDSLVDGWSTGHMELRLASVRGYSHRFSGTPRQDDAVVAFHRPTDSIVFAVADGVSNARYSAVGAGLACRTAVSVLANGLDAGRSVAWTPLAQSVALKLTEHAEGAGLLGAGVDRPVAADYATTLVAGHVAPGPAGGLVATMIQIGDSGAWVLADGEFVDVLAPKTSPGATVVSSAVLALPSLPEVVPPVTVDVGPDDVLLVGTDGVGDPLGDGTGMVGDLLREVLREPPPPLGWAHAVDFSRETFDDDRTLLAVWPRPLTSARR